jgi:hypothetical protein
LCNTYPHTSTLFDNPFLHCAGTHPHIQLHSLDPTLPYLLYLPNLDGTGITCKPQWPRMAAHFNLHTLSIPTENRWSFEQLVQYVKVSTSSARSSAVHALHHACMLWLNPPSTWSSLLAQPMHARCVPG